MFKTVPIELSRLSPIEQIRLKNGHITSAHSFLSCYIWQHDLKLSMYAEPDVYVVRTQLYGENSWYFPCGEKKAVERLIRTLAEEKNLSLHYLREQDVEFMQTTFAGKFKIERTPEDDEYLYDRKQQIEQSGKKFHATRRYLNRIKEEHVLTCEWIDIDNIDRARRISDAWQRDAVVSTGVKSEAAANCILNEWSEIDNVQGLIVSVDGEDYSLIIGYPLSDDMFDICITRQKGLISGLGIYTKCIFIEKIDKSYILFNGEEDLGIAGLRTMKNQMRPIDKILMYKATLL